MTKEENIDFAKETMLENIYHSAMLEGCNLTISETEVILSDVSVAPDNHDVNIVVNLKKAWDHVITNIDKPFDLEFLKGIHSFVGYNEALKWGEFRDGEVGITGVTYKPLIPNQKEIMKEVSELFSLPSTTDKAIKFMLWAMRRQLFWDGNKRTSIMSANKLLIAEGKGIITIKEEYIPEFNKRLSAFYETNDFSKIDSFIYEKCFYGINKNSNLPIHEIANIFEIDVQLVKDVQKKSKVDTFKRLAGSALTAGEDIKELLKAANHENEAFFSVPDVHNEKSSVYRSIKLLKMHLLSNKETIENLEYYLDDSHNKVSDQERKEILNDIANLKEEIISHRQAIEILEKHQLLGIEEDKQSRG